MTRKYTVVSFPFAGTFTVSLEGEFATEREAIDAAWEKYHEKGEEAGEIEEWELVEELVSGNVLRVSRNEVTVDVYED